MNSVIVILKRELRSYFLSPVAYAVMVMFLLISGYFFYSGMVFYGMASFEASRMAQYMGPQELDMASFVLRPLFGNMGVVMLLLAPLVTMRLFSEEMKNGSIELLLTWPVTGLQLTLGKYLAALGLFGAMLSVTFVYTALASIYGPVAWGAVAAAYLGLLLLAASFVALGMFISTLTENQIISAAVSFGSLLMLWVISWTVGSDSGPLAETLRHISILEHMETFAKGVIDTKDLVYYLSFIFLFIFLTLRSLESRSWRA
ncbi:MAG: ABC transporter permease subunit [Nitrospinae bacterium]|nr:ABC transporter permease subunit [Nitrospinota bacterium]